MYNKYKTNPDNHDFMGKDHVANFLRNHRTGVDNWGREALAKIVRQYNNPIVLDAACGTCVNWEVFRNNNIQCQYIGLDSSQNLLNHAKEIYGDNIILKQGYVQELPFKDNSVDIVILRHILEHLEDGYEQAIREGLRVANKELIIVFFLHPSPNEKDNIKESDPDENKCTFFWNIYNGPKMEKFIRQFSVKILSTTIKTPGAAHDDFIVRLIK